MSQLNWYLLSIVSSLDKIKVVAKSNGVCQYRINNLKNATKYLEGEGEGAPSPSPLNFVKSGDQKYLFYVIICILKCLVIKTIIF